MVRKILFPTLTVPQFDVVSDADKRNMVFQSGSFAQSFIQEQSPLAVQLHLAGQSKTYSLEYHSLIRRSGPGRDRKGYLLKILLGVQTEYAVGAEDKVEIAAVLIDINLTSQFGRDEDSAFAVDNVLVFAC
jgi:hypothetical protein